jgi:hypothetical protein
MVQMRRPETESAGLIWDRRATRVAAAEPGKTDTTPQFLSHCEAAVHCGPLFPADRDLRQQHTPAFLQHAMLQAQSWNWTGGKLNGARNERTKTNAEAARRVPAKTEP